MFNLWLIFQSVGWAQNLSVVEHQAPSAFEAALETQSAVTVRERWIEYGQTRYREVEYRGEKYYIKATQRKGDFEELDCTVPAQINPSRLEVGVQVIRRTQAFVSFLRESCTRNPRGQLVTKFILDPRLGFPFPDDPKSVIKDKRVFWNPSMPLGLGLSGDW